MTLFEGHSKAKLFKLVITGTACFPVIAVQVKCWCSSDGPVYGTVYCQYRNYPPSHILTSCHQVTVVTVNTLQRTGDADLRFYVTTVQDG